MSPVVNFLPAAASEAVDAAEWYGERETRLADEFRSCLDAAVRAIQQEPLAFPVVHGSAVRRILTKRFPYSIIYTVTDDAILVIAVFHSSRNPIVWRGRV